MDEVLNRIKVVRGAWSNEGAERILCAHARASKVMSSGVHLARKKPP